MIVMYDSTQLSEIPKGAEAVAGYVGGNFQTFGDLLKGWPRAHHLSIAVNSSENARCLDIENGDATPPDATAWYHRQIARGVSKPVFYASLSVVTLVEGELAKAGILRGDYLVWSAHYTGQPHICGPSEGLSVPADATQWTDKALGRNLDESLCSDGFFENPLDVLLEPERRAVNNYDAYMRHPHLHEHGIKVAKDEMIAYRKLIWLAAVKGRNGHGKSIEKGWNVHDRKARYELLLDRTGG